VSAAPQPAFSLGLRVYWEDTDAGGVVYHASYLRFLERARTEWLRAAGVDQSELRVRADRLLVVRSMSLEFLAPAHLDDWLAVDVTPAERRGASAWFTQVIRRGETPLLTARVRIASLRASDFRPAPLPDGLWPA
jgi:acyl-CoA thioester hydrolase